MNNMLCCYREQLAFSLYTTFQEPKLYRMAARGEWDLIPARCISHPKEAEFRHKYAPNETTLHRLLRTVEFETSLDLDDSAMSEMGLIKLNAVRAILAANRACAMVRDSFGKTPLHYACMSANASAGKETIQAIVEANPAACSLQDNEGRTPLHYLVARNDVIPRCVVKLLLDPCSLPLETKDMMKETPLEILLRRRDEIVHVDGLIKILTPL